MKNVSFLEISGNIATFTTITKIWTRKLSHEIKSAVDNHEIKNRKVYHFHDICLFSTCYFPNPSP